MDDRKSLVPVTEENRSLAFGIVLAFYMILAIGFITINWRLIFVNVLNFLFAIVFLAVNAMSALKLTVNSKRYRASVEFPFYVSTIIYTALYTIFNIIMWFLAYVQSTGIYLTISLLICLLYKTVLVITLSFAKRDMR